MEEAPDGAGPGADAGVEPGVALADEDEDTVACVALAVQAGGGGPGGSWGSGRSGRLASARWTPELTWFWSKLQFKDHNRM